MKRRAFSRKSLRQLTQQRRAFSLQNRAFSFQLRSFASMARRGSASFSFPLRSFASWLHAQKTSLQQKVLTAAYASARRGHASGSKLARRELSQQQQQQQASCRLQEIFVVQRASTMCRYPRPCNATCPSTTMTCTWVFATLCRTTWQERGQTRQEQKS